MTKHDEIRQILHETALLKFDDGRTALDMTDEEVEIFVAHFIKIMAEFGRHMTKVVQGAVVAMNRAMEPVHLDLVRLSQQLQERRVQ